MSDVISFRDGIATLRSRLRAGQISAEAVTAFYLERIERLDPIFNSFIEVNPAALSQSKAIRRTDSRPLAGIPISVKDLILTRDLATTGGSRVPMPALLARRDAKVVEALRTAGAIILGKTNLHEFAFGITNENIHFGPVRNPWNQDCVSGGSSGGSAVAVAARLSPGSIGTDTRGSIRIPASCCGVSGLKPTRGRVSTQGVLPLSWTLDHVGPLASCVDDLKILFDVIRRDKPANRDHEECRRLRLATIPYFQERIHPDVQKAVTAAIDTFRSDGHKVTEIELAGLKEAIDASDVISRSEAVTVHHESLTQWPQYYDPRVRERLSTGYELSARDLVQAQRLRAELIRSFKRVFRRIDCIVAPALPVVAPPIGTTSIRFGPDSESIVYCFVRLMAIQNMAGLPALSIPCGFSADDMPIGMQLIGGRGSDDLLLTLGSRFQELTSWHQRVPNAVATAERER